MVFSGQTIPKRRLQQMIRYESAKSFCKFHHQWSSGPATFVRIASALLHVCTQKYVSTHTHTQTHKHIKYTCTHKHVTLYTHPLYNTHTHTHTQYLYIYIVWVCMRESNRGWIYIYIYIYIYVCMYVCIYMHMYCAFFHCP